MVRKAVLVVAAAAVFGLFSGIVRAEEAPVPAQEAPVAAATEAVSAPVNVGNKVCPVGGEKIEEAKKEVVEYEGKTYNLCCAACKDKFVKDPSAYTAKAEAEVAAAGGETAPAAEAPAAAK